MNQINKQINKQVNRIIKMIDRYKSLGYDVSCIRHTSSYDIAHMRGAIEMRGASKAYRLVRHSIESLNGVHR